MLPLLVTMNHLVIYDDSTPTNLITKGYSSFNSANELSDRVVVSFAQLAKLTGTPLISAVNLDEAIKQLSQDLYAGFGKKVVIRVIINLSNVEEANPYGFNPTLTPVVLEQTHYPKLNVFYNRHIVTLGGSTHHTIFTTGVQHPILDLVETLKQINPNARIAVEGTTQHSFGETRGYSTETINRLKEFDITLLPSRMDGISNVKFANLIRGGELAIINEESLSGFFFNSQETFEVGYRGFM